MNFQADKNTRALPRWMAGERDRAGHREAATEYYREPNALLKRASDVVLGVLGIAVSIPIVAVIVPLIKLTSPGPVIYRQERVGQNRRRSDRRNGNGNSVNGGNRRAAERRASAGFGKPFTLYKFRTMRVDSENGSPQFSGPRDPRITRLGRFMRRTRIDEIPQFVNVLRGEMSVVGPRPERPYFFAKADATIPRFKERVRVKPGLTGLAQVEQGYANSIKGLGQKLEYDLKYIQNAGAVTDAKILLRTVSVVLTGKGAC